MIPTCSTFVVSRENGNHQDVVNFSTRKGFFFTENGKALFNVFSIEGRKYAVTRK